MQSIRIRDSHSLLKTMEGNNWKHLPAREPTSDRNKLSHLVNFCVAKGIAQDFTVVKSYFDLTSDYSPIVITLTADVLNEEKDPILCNRHTNWDAFRCLVNERFTLHIPLKPRKTLKQQPSSSVIQFNSQVGMQRRNIEGHSRHTTAV
jgi:hypothetical protein